MMRRAALTLALLIASALPAQAQQPPPGPPPVLQQPQIPPLPPTEDITVVGQRPVDPITPTTMYWVEDAYATYPLLGPTFAKGLIIWNHQRPWDGIGPAVPPIRAMEGMAALGWDIVRLQRNPQNRGDWESSSERVAGVLTEQIAKAHADGYQRIILAGQDFGGALSLVAGRFIDGLYGIIAFAPNTGIKWGLHGQGAAPIPSDELTQLILTRTWDELEHVKAERLMLLFPTADEQVPRARGPTAREILTRRKDLSFLLVDETSNVRTTAGADTPDFDAYASCLDLYLEPDLTPRHGEFHCGADEIPLALAQMGVKPHGGEGWFGYSDRGQALYVELPAGGRGPVTYGWGAGANGKTRPGSRNLDPTVAGAGFTAELSPDRMLHGVHVHALLRLTIDQEDGTRAAAVMHRLPGNS
jgi:hypothetical protein